MAILRVVTQPRSKRQSWTELPPANWAERQAYQVAQEIVRLRGKRSAQWLANRTNEIGYEVSRSVISDIENGRRRYITTAELLVIAAALDTSPVALVYPGPYDSEVEVVPGCNLREIHAAEWFSGIDDVDHLIGEMVLPGESRRGIPGADWQAWTENIQALEAWRALRHLERLRNELYEDDDDVDLPLRRIATVEDQIKVMRKYIANGYRDA